MKYQIRYEPIGGQYYYMIYRKVLFGWEFHERWNDAESVEARIKELQYGRGLVAPGCSVMHRFREGEICNGMLKHEGRIYACTDMGVYEITPNGLKELDPLWTKTPGPE